MGAARVCGNRKSYLYCGLLLGIIACSSDPVEEIYGFTPSEYRAVQRMAETISPALDSSNRWDGDASAIALGEELFFSESLSPVGVSCATCHDPEKGFSDGRRVSEGIEQTSRHAPHLYEQAGQTWFFWDGRCDSLWCQAASPIEASGEMASSRTAVGHALQDNSTYQEMYEDIFGPLPELSHWPQQAKPDGEEDSLAVIAWSSMTEEEQRDATSVFVNVVKAIAAFENTIETPTSDIDQFTAQFRQNEEEALEGLTATQERGLRLFVGKGNCHFCHAGAAFTNGEFHNIGLGGRDWLSDTDVGRYSGIESLQANPFNRGGLWSDSPDDQLAERIDRLMQSTEQLGQFKVPSLRNVKNTAPYMHGGHFDTLEQVVQFYITLGETSVQGHREELLFQQSWSQEEIDALVAFLEML